MSAYSERLLHGTHRSMNMLAQSYLDFNFWCLVRTSRRARPSEEARGVPLASMSAVLRLLCKLETPRNFGFRSIRQAKPQGRVLGTRMGFSSDSDGRRLTWTDRRNSHQGFGAKEGTMAATAFTVGLGLDVWTSQPQPLCFFLISGMRILTLKLIWPVETSGMPLKPENAKLHFFQGCPLPQDLQTVSFLFLFGPRFKYSPIGSGGVSPKGRAR